MEGDGACEIRGAASVRAKASHSLCPCAAGSAKVVSLKEGRLRKRKKKRELQRPKNSRGADRRREELPVPGELRVGCCHAHNQSGGCRTLKAAVSKHEAAPPPSS
jgi:hypothetical protein